MLPSRGALGFFNTLALQIKYQLLVDIGAHADLHELLGEVHRLFRSMHKDHGICMDFNNVIPEAKLGMRVAAFLIGLPVQIGANGWRGQA